LSSSLYRSSGHSYLVCPRLLEVDHRHGEHPDKWPPCRRGHQCVQGHDHEPTLIDSEGHTVQDFYWVPGSRPPTADEHPACGCGRKLVHADLDDLYDARHLVAVD